MLKKLSHIIKENVSVDEPKKVTKKQPLNESVHDMKLNESVFGNTFYISETQWKKFKNICKDVLKFPSIKDGIFDLVVDVKKRQAFARFDTSDSEVSVDMSEATFDKIVQRMDVKLLKIAYGESINESYSEFNTGDKVKIIDGEFKNQKGVISLVLKDTYILKLKNGKGVEVNNHKIEKV